jgi:thioesterase DpgC
LPVEAADEWGQANPQTSAGYEADVARYGLFWSLGARLLQALPEKPKRNEAEAAAAGALLEASRASRELFLSAHAEPIYEELTEGRTLFRRLDDLVYAAAEFAPGLTPTRQEVAAEAARRQDDKDGVEIDQGIFLAHVLAHPRSGEHLCRAPKAPNGSTNSRQRGPSILARRALRERAKPSSSKSSIRVFSTRKTMRPCARPRSRSTSRSSIDRARSP